MTREVGASVMRGGILLLAIICCADEPAGEPPEGSEEQSPTPTGSADAGRESGGAGAGKANLSFTKDSYGMETGALFDVTVKVEAEVPLAEGSRVLLKLVDRDDNEAGSMMQWQDAQEEMQPHGAEITAAVKDGKAEFKNLFIVAAHNVSKLQATLTHADSSSTAQPATSELSSTSRSAVVQVANLNLNGGYSPHLAISGSGINLGQVNTDIYFFNANSNPPMLGKHSGSGQQQSIQPQTKEAIEGTDCHDYRLVIKFNDNRVRYQSSLSSCND